MRVRLTRTQLYQLMPYFDRVRATAAAGSPGMLVAQLWFDAHRSEYYLEPAFLDHELAKVITERGLKLSDAAPRSEVVSAGRSNS